MRNFFGKAIAILDKRGWHQGDWDGPNGEVCLGKAALLAGAPYWAGHWLSEHFLSGRTPADFNDDPATSIEDVKLLLKHASAAWDEEHPNA